MAQKTKNLGKLLREGDYALDLVTGFPVIIRDVARGAYTRHCEFFGFNHGFGGVYSKNLRPITADQFRSLMNERLFAPGFYFHPFSQGYWGVYDKTGTIVCMTVYKKGAAEAVRRFRILAESCHSAIRFISGSAISNSSSAKKMFEIISNGLEQTEGPNGKIQNA